jgi:hypothetical protein
MNGSSDVRVVWDLRMAGVSQFMKTLSKSISHGFLHVVSRLAEDSPRGIPQLRIPRCHISQGMEGSS